MAQIAYMYSPHNGEYLGTYKCQPNPMSAGDFLIPANATLIQPMASGENQIPVWSGIEWSLVENYRGQLCINPKTGKIQEINELGNIPVGFYLMNESDVENYKECKIPSVENGMLVWHDAEKQFKEIDNTNFNTIILNYASSIVKINNYGINQFAWQLEEAYESCEDTIKGAFSVDDWRYALWQAFYPVIESVNDIKLDTLLANVEG